MKTSNAGVMLQVKTRYPDMEKDLKEMIQMERIVTNPEMLGGKPIIKGARLSEDVILCLPLV